MTTYFPNVPEVKYEGTKTKNPYAFRYYDADRLVGGKPMKEHLKFSLSWWHTLCAGGGDPFGSETMDRTYGGLTDPMEIAHAKVDAGFELMEKLGIEYFCFHDADVAPRELISLRRARISLRLFIILSPKWIRPALSACGAPQIVSVIQDLCMERVHPAAPTHLPGRPLKSRTRSTPPFCLAVRAILSGVDVKAMRPCSTPTWVWSWTTWPA